MNHVDRQYLELITDVMDNGVDKGDRTGTGTRSVFGRQLRFNSKRGFPLLTAKRTWLKGALHEILWMLSGSTNIKYLTDNDVHIWDEWANEEGELGPVYGSQWREWLEHRETDTDHYGSGGPERKVIDQITRTEDMLNNNPNSRRILVTCWNPGKIDLQALAPCHFVFQLRTRGDVLDMHMTIRSNDLGLGMPFNIAGYYALLMMFAKSHGYEPGELVYSIGDAHIYHNHMDKMEQLVEQGRVHRSLPTLNIKTKRDSVVDYVYDDFELIGYEHGPQIDLPVAV